MLTFVQARLDQVLYWVEAGRVVVQVEYFDVLGKLKQEKFYFANGNAKAALLSVAGQLAKHGVEGSGRVRQRVGTQLVRQLELEKEFLITLNRDD